MNILQSVFTLIVDFLQALLGLLQSFFNLVMDLLKNILGLF